MISYHTISIIGCGYVGLTTAAILANCGYKVYAIEKNPERLKTIKSGQSFFYENGIDSLIASGISNGNLICTDTYKESIPNSEIIFSCVGTPDNQNGSPNLTYVFEAARQVSEYIKPDTLYVQKSTVPVGTGLKIKAIFEKNNIQAMYVSNPEFLREGSAISDSLWFDRVVVGGDSEHSSRKIIDIYKTIEYKSPVLAQIADIPTPNEVQKPDYIATSCNSAELIKVTANAFLALKISFANSIAKLADNADADVVDVMQAVGADKRIGKAFLQAGRGYGGGCFPKDVSGLIHSASEYKVKLGIMEAASELNDSMPQYIVEKAKDALGGSFHNKKAAVLGLAFKTGTSDARCSPAVMIANILATSGAQVKAFDPKANTEAQKDTESSIIITESLEAAVENVDCIFVATDWPEFINMNLDEITQLSQASVFVDCMNRFNPEKTISLGLIHIGVGR